jgi:hypothetical protein
MRTFLIITCSLIINLTSGQTAKDYFNEEVKDAQLATAQTIMTALENGKIELAGMFFDDSIKNLRSELNYISSEISKVKAETKLSIVIVFDHASNIYRCRYSNDSDELFQVDLFMSEGQANSKVKKLEIKNSDVLKMEAKERMEMKEPPQPPN